MNQTDSARFKSALCGTFEVYEKQLTPAMVSIWWAALKQFSIDDFCTALTAHITDPDVGQYVPKPADVIKKISGTEADNSALAWAKVTNAIRLGGSRSVCFDDVAINQVILEMGGWPALCHTDTDKLHFKGKDFESRYKKYLSNPPVNPPTHLIGREEQANKQAGFQSDAPVMIGDKQLARLNYSKKPDADNRVLSFISGGAK